MPGDLHTHTTFSDGSTPADKLPFLAACAGMTHLAISDHDSIRSVRYAYAHPVQNGVHLIPATELTAYDYERAHRVHLLCYWPDDCAALADFSAMMAERRLTAMLQSCKELEAICPQFRTEEALELAKDSGTLFKAQVMRVLWQYGLADGMYNTVYKSLFGLKPVRGRILHTPRYEPVDTVLDVIKASRAVVVLAHPSVYHSMELARELIAAGRLDGVEIDHPRNTPEDRAELTRLAKENGLIVTGGTDYHGINTVTPRPVGAFTTCDEMIARIGDIAKARKSTYNNKGTCSVRTVVELNDDHTIKSVQILGGCDGNLKGIANLLPGMKAEDAIARMEGTTCGRKPTSCPDQIAQALKGALAEMG